MQEYNTNNKTSRRLLPLLVFVAFAVLASMGLMASSRAANTIGVTVNNNSGREVRHLYLAPGNPNNWGPDQLGGSTIPSGSSYTVNNVSCDGALTVIAEDQNGCFFYNNTSCGSNVVWTIAANATPDCGN